MIVSHIVAATENNVIGLENDLPWSLPDDMKFFKETTKGHYVIMGRKNYESLPPKWRPLPNRSNVIVTRNKDLKIEGTTVVNSIEEGIEVAQNDKELETFIIGGGEIFHQSLDLIDRIYFTQIHTEIEGDTFYPEIDMTKWEEVSRREHPADERHPYSFTFLIYEKKP